MGLNDFYDVLKLEMYQFFNIDGQLWNLIIKWDLVQIFQDITCYRQKQII